MKVAVHQPSLVEALGHASRAINASAASANHMYANIKISASDKRLTLTATDGVVTVTSSIVAPACTVEEKGEAVVPANLFIKLAASLPQGATTLQMEKKGKLKMLASGSLAMELTCADSSQYPIPNNDGEFVTIQMPAPVIYEMMRKCVYAVSKDEIGSPVLKNILLRFKNDEVIVAATNGRILSEVKSRQDFREASLGKVDLLIPAVASNIIYDNSMFGGDGVVIIKIPKDSKKRNCAIFQKGEVVLRTTLFAGIFPTYEKVIPEPAVNPVVVMRDGLLSSVKRASILSQSGEGGYVTLSFEKNSVRIISQESEAGMIDDRINAKYEGEEMSIPLAARYLIPILKAMDDDEIKINVYSANKPLMITGGIPFTALLMPIRRSQEA